jgi:hypothetical protein
MDEVLYLVHSTNADPATLKTLKPSDISDIGQFPGVFMSIITRKNYGNEQLFPGKYYLIFSKELLKQRNYHFNLQDSNGMLNETFTYFPWNIEDAIPHIKAGGMNELVFHDPVDMKYCCKIVDKITLKITLESSVEDWVKYFEKGGIWQLFPKKPMKNRARPNMTLLPWYGFINEDMYDGTVKIPPNSFAWYKMLARTANLEAPYRSKRVIIERLRAKASHMYANRGEQNLLEIEEYTKKRGTL